MRHLPTFSEKIKKFLALTFLRLPLSIIKLLIGKPIQIDGQNMDPVVQFMVKFFVDHEIGYIPSMIQFMETGLNLITTSIVRGVGYGWVGWHKERVLAATYFITTRPPKTCLLRSTTVHF